MIELTKSLNHWLFENHKDIYSLVLFGHAELLTEEMWGQYIEWCRTEDGKQYLEGGAKREEVEA